MTLIRINRHPSRGQLLVFALAWTTFCGGIAMLAWRREHGNLAIAWTFSGALMPAAWLVFRPAVRWAFLGLSYATYPIGLVVSHVVLAVIFYGVLTPIGLVMRGFGYDSLARRFGSKASTYWRVRTQPRSAADYLRQS